MGRKLTELRRLEHASLLIQTFNTRFRERQSMIIEKPPDVAHRIPRRSLKDPVIVIGNSSAVKQKPHSLFKLTVIKRLEKFSKISRANIALLILANLFKGPLRVFTIAHTGMIRSISNGDVINSPGYRHLIIPVIKERTVKLENTPIPMSRIANGTWIIFAFASPMFNSSLVTLYQRVKGITAHKGRIPYLL